MAQEQRKIKIKHEMFLREDIGHKSLTHISGIGPTTEKQLNRRGIYKAKDLYKKYVRYKDKKSKFMRFLLDTCPGCNASQIHDALKEWGEQHDGQPSTSSGERPVLSKLPRNSRAQEANRDQQPLTPDVIIEFLLEDVLKIAPHLCIEFSRELSKIIQHYQEKSKDEHAAAADILPDL